MPDFDNKEFLVSVVMPAFNAENHIEESIASVIQQTYTNWELIIVDDGSTDSTPNLSLKYNDKYPAKIILLQHENGINKGVSESRNLGIKKSSGAFIYFLDSDDILLPDTLNKYIGVFQIEPAIALIHAKIILNTTEINKPDFEKNFDMGENGRKYKLSEEPYYLQYNRICNSTTCLRKSCIEGLSLNFKQAFQIEDWVLWTLLSQFYEFYYLPIPAIKYRYHSDSITFKVIKNDVYQQYSFLEYYFAVLSKAETQKLKTRCLEKIYEQINTLYANYAENNIVLVPNFLHLLLDEKCKALENENKNLSDKLNSRYGIKNLLNVFLKRLRLSR